MSLSQNSLPSIFWSFFFRSLDKWPVRLLLLGTLLKPAISKWENRPCVQEICWLQTRRGSRKNDTGKERKLFKNTPFSWLPLRVIGPQPNSRPSIQHYIFAWDMNEGLFVLSPFSSPICQGLVTLRSVNTSYLQLCLMHGLECLIELLNPVWWWWICPRAENKTSNHISSS